MHLRVTAVQLNRALTYTYAALIHVFGPKGGYETPKADIIYKLNLLNIYIEKIPDSPVAKLELKYPNLLFFST
jgi:hypothetical protein